MAPLGGPRPPPPASGHRFTGTVLDAETEGSRGAQLGLPPVPNKEGDDICDEDIAHLSPARYAHINPYGKFTFDLAQASRENLRPLRKA